MKAGWLMPLHIIMIFRIVNRNNIRIRLNTFIHLQFTRLHGGEDRVLEVGEDLGPLGVELGRAERGEQPGAGGGHQLRGEER